MAGAAAGSGKGRPARGHAILSVPHPYDASMRVLDLNNVSPALEAWDTLHVLFNGKSHAWCLHLRRELSTLEMAGGT